MLGAAAAAFALGAVLGANPGGDRRPARRSAVPSARAPAPIAAAVDRMSLERQVGRLVILR